MLDRLILEDDKTIKVVSDPLRQKILRVLLELGPSTSSGVARALGIAASKAHYHLAKLEDVGLLVLDREEVIHGITARYLAPVARSFVINTESIRNNPAVQTTALQVARTELDRVHQSLALALEQPETTKALLLLSQVRLTEDEFEGLSQDVDGLLRKWEEVSRAHGAGEVPSLKRWKLLTAAVPEEE